VKLVFLFAFLSLPPLEKQGIDHLYNLDFQAAIETFQELAREQPSSPAGPHYLASAIWMEEMTRRGAMAGETFQSSRYWTRKRAEPPSDEAQDRFDAQVEEAIRRSKLVLSARENDREALYFWGATESVVSAYEATIRRRYFAAYRAGRRALKQHEKLLELDPSWADAHLVPGIYEYTMATLPRSVKILGFLIGMRGSKEKGAEHLRKAVRDGERTYWGARLSLIVLETREKRYHEALRYLRELETTFPKNPLFPLEKGWVYLLKKDWSAARRTFRAAQKKQRLQQPHYGRVHPSFILLRLGESYLFDKRVGEAIGRFDEALARTDIPDTVRSVLHLRRGQAYDSLHRREDARAEYETTIRLNTDKASYRLAKRYLKDPFRLSPGS
jgi:tetratricopeptide (TPR) repeat protein